MSMCLMACRNVARSIRMRRSNAGRGTRSRKQNFEACLKRDPVLLPEQTGEQGQWDRKEAENKLQRGSPRLAYSHLRLRWSRLTWLHQQSPFLVNDIELYPLMQTATSLSRTKDSAKEWSLSVYKQSSLRSSPFRHPPLRWCHS